MLKINRANIVLFIFFKNIKLRQNNIKKKKKVYLLRSFTDWCNKLKQLREQNSH